MLINNHYNIMTMTMPTTKYNLKEFTDITFNGFDVVLPPETLSIINELSKQVGSPTYIKTPTFQKRENIITSELTSSNKKNKNKAVEILNDNDWETLRTFQTTKIDQKVGINAHIDILRFWLNKISDKTFSESYDKILEILDQLIKEETSNADMTLRGNTIFEIASNNRLFSKLYADLYCRLIDKYEIMKNVFDVNILSFMDLFNCIEYSDPSEDYNSFCKNNKDNERRKALSLFFVNLTNNNIIDESKIISLTCDLLTKLIIYMKEYNKTNQVNEITDNISILYSYKKEMFGSCDVLFDEEYFIPTIKKLAHCKAKTYPSLSTKSIFKFMDLLDM